MTVISWYVKKIYVDFFFPYSFPDPLCGCEPGQDIIAATSVNYNKLLLRVFACSSSHDIHPFLLLFREMISFNNKALIDLPRSNYSICEFDFKMMCHCLNGVDHFLRPWGDASQNAEIWRKKNGFVCKLRNDRAVVQHHTISDIKKKKNNWYWYH